MYERPRLSYLGGAMSAISQWRDSTDERMQRIYQAVTSAHSMGDLTLYAFGRRFGLSSSYLSRVFKQAAGTSFRDLVVHTRQNCAAELVRTTDLSIKEIAAQSGYKHVSDFSACFKRIHGVSPTEYRFLCGTSTVTSRV